MKETYEEAITQVFKDEGGYSNDPGDHGGPTKYGITIYDARMYWKPNATAEDVRSMPKSVAEDIYRKHYAGPLGYDNLNPGVDYAELDYGVHSGVNRATRVLKEVGSSDPVKTINAIYDEREAFLRRLGQKPSQAKFLGGWLSRTKRGRKLALDLYARYSQPKVQSKIKPEHKATTGTVVATGAAASAYPHLALYIIGGGIVLAIGLFFLIKYLKRKQNV